MRELERQLRKYGELVDEKVTPLATYQLRQAANGNLREVRIDNKHQLVQIRKSENRRFNQALWEAIGTPEDKSTWMFPGRKANTGVIWKRIVRDLYDHIESPRHRAIEYDWKTEYEVLKQRIEDAKGYDNPPEYLKHAATDLKITKAFERFLKEIDSIHSGKSK